MEIQSDVDLYLLYSPSSGEYEAVKNWSSLPKSIGILVPLVDDTWYPSSIQDNSPNVSWTMYFYLVGAGYDIQTDIARIPSSQNQFPPPQSFTLIQNARNTSQVIANSTDNTTPTTAQKSPTNDMSSNSKLPSWAIAVICVVSVLFLVALGALFFAMRRFKNKKQAELVVATEHANDEKLLVPDNIALTAAAAPAGTRETSSIHSNPTLLQQTLNRSARQHEEEKLPLQQPLGLNSEANQSSSILSSTDALMIADTFRQFMRKPEWNENHDLNDNNK